VPGAKDILGPFLRVIEESDFFALPNIAASDEVDGGVVDNPDPEFLVVDDPEFRVVVGPDAEDLFSYSLIFVAHKSLRKTGNFGKD
jgi:hypothetical protein